MELIDLVVRGVGWRPLAAGLFFVLGTLTLLFSMIVASRLASGIDFGPVQYVLPKGAALVAVVTAVNLLDCGIVLAGPVWFFGLMAAFGLDLDQTRTLTKVNWGMNLVWKLLLLPWML
jgi:hypothetical protein